MNFNSCGVVLWIYAVIFVCSEATDQFKRQIKHQFNCTKDGDENSILVYSVKAEGPHDDLFHIWDSRGPFTVMILRFPKYTVLETADCSKILSSDFNDALIFNQTLDYSFAVIMTKLFEYADPDDLGKYKTGDDIDYFNFTDFKWTTQLTTTEDGVSMKYSLTAPDEPNKLEISGVQMELTLRDSTDRSDKLPRLVYTANSTIVNFVLQNTSLHYNHSRFGVVFHLLNSNNTTPFDKTVPKSIDDEYTPGVFKMVQVSTEQKLGGYMEWKPTVYTTSNHKHDQSTETQESNVYNNTQDLALEKSIAYAIYGDEISNMAQSMNVSFGMHHDNYYESAKYSSWTFSIGCGEIPSDEVSILVIVVITVGLGIPILLIIGGVVYILVKRYKAQHDDLLLSS